MLVRQKLLPEAYPLHHPKCCGAEVDGDAHDDVLKCDAMLCQGYDDGDVV